MQYISKGQPPKGGSYLACDNSRRHHKGGCQGVPWRYSEFETDLLRFLSFQIDVSKLLPDHDETEREIDGLKLEQTSIRGQLSKATSKIENLTDSISTTNDKRNRAELDKKLSVVLDEKERLEKAAREKEDKINALERSGNNLQERIENVKELTGYLKRAKPGEVIDIRLKLREAIRGVVDEITLFSRGYRDRKHVNEEESNPQRRRVLYEGIGNKDWRLYSVRWKGGGVFTRFYYPEGAGARLGEIRDKEFSKRKGFKELSEWIKRKDFGFVSGRK